MNINIFMNSENNNVSFYEIVKCLMIYDSAYFCSDLIYKFYSTK